MPKRFVDRGPELYDYLIAASSRESALKKELREATAKLPDARMQITPEQGQFMALLAKSIGAKRALEIGLYTGYSAWCVAEAIDEGGNLIACDASAEWTSIAREFWEKAGVAEKIDLRIAPALETLASLEADGQGGALDYAIIDAEKGKYASYYETCLRLLRSGGLIVVDNALFGEARSWILSTRTWIRLPSAILMRRLGTMSGWMPACYRLATAFTWLESVEEPWQKN